MTSTILICQGLQCGGRRLPSFVSRSLVCSLSAVRQPRTWHQEPGTVIQSSSVRIAASAPTRIDLAGGTIDIWPLYLFHEGASTVNAAISLRAHVTVEPREDEGIEIRSIDTNRRIAVRHWSAL